MNANGNFDESNDSSNKNEETPLLERQEKNNGGSVTLDTIVDSIKYIIKRDSEIALYNEETPQSPWKFDATEKKNIT